MIQNDKPNEIDETYYVFIEKGAQPRLTARPRQGPSNTWRCFRSIKMSLFRTTGDRPLAAHASDKVPRVFLGRLLAVHWHKTIYVFSWAGWHWLIMDPKTAASRYTMRETLPTNWQLARNGGLQLQWSYQTVHHAHQSDHHARTPIDFAWLDFAMLKL